VAYSENIAVALVCWDIKHTYQIDNLGSKLTSLSPAMSYTGRFAIVSEQVQFHRSFLQVANWACLQ
jgi:hypothetical protein